MTTRLKVRYDGQSLVPMEPVDLPTGLTLEIDVHLMEDPPKGSAAAVLKMLKSLPPLDPQTGEEFERAIAHH